MLYHKLVDLRNFGFSTNHSCLYKGGNSPRGAEMNKSADVILTKTANIENKFIY